MYDLDLSVDDDGFVCDDAFEAEHKHNYVRYEWKGAGYGDKLKPGQRWHLTRCTHAMRMSPVVKKIALVLASGNEAAHVRDIRITLQGVDDWTMINVFPDGPCIVDGAEWEAWECRFLERIPSYYMQVDERRRRLNEMGTRGDLPTGIELSDMLAYVHEIGMSRDISNTDLVMINRLRNSGRSQHEDAIH